MNLNNVWDLGCGSSGRFIIDGMQPIHNWRCLHSFWYSEVTEVSLNARMFDFMILYVVLDRVIVQIHKWNFVVPLRKIFLSFSSGELGFKWGIEVENLKSFVSHSIIHAWGCLFEPCIVVCVSGTSIMVRFSNSGLVGDKHVQFFSFLVNYQIVRFTDFPENTHIFVIPFWLVYFPG